ncbi:DNA polymerase III subunit epsilon [Methylovirgula ligni]|uniref:DNA polymerase III subunit epsilon n=1 Tax=Methylovirgula ligni TaxID=569860 RepID=A0A3D9Z300_9HYPH|nr:DNA polymerase III subunit epsilon [Methylovirgula ligni]QAY95189.1 DNA polymerase III subunit epsilon [Methylovirgula ligni]REF89522.1 DNA polymerase-3 subunit epsilon [Methylovirgula ligni]
MREIVFDTETTGLDPASGHRIVEIGCVEILNAIPTGQTFHFYLDPERDMPEEAFRVHGLSLEFLTGKPKFAEIAEQFLSFIADAVLVAHNAEFDLRFVNAELAVLGHPPLKSERIVDTLALARRRHPGAPNSLDALCQRYGIDTKRRTKHGALLDAEILAEVYAELNGGRQASLSLQSAAGNALRAAVRAERPAPLAPLIVAAEWAAHAAFIATLGNKAIWRRYLPESDEA